MNPSLDNTSHFSPYLFYNNFPQRVYHSNESIEGPSVAGSLEVRRGIYGSYAHSTQSSLEDCTFHSPLISNCSSDFEGVDNNQNGGSSSNFVPAWNSCSSSLDSAEASMVPGRLPPMKQEIYTNFTQPADLSVFLKGSSHPKQPCDYCRRNRLECIVLYTDPQANPNPVEACSSCVGLNRECSRSKGQRREAASFEDSEPGYGPLRSLKEQVEEPENGNAEWLALFVAAHNNQPPPATERVPRSLRRARAALNDWYQQHRDHPYPTPEEHAQLTESLGLTSRQVSDWFSNRRRRDVYRKRGLHRKGVFRPASPMPSTPMDRWSRSPPEQEPAKIEDILKAMKHGVEVHSSPSQCTYPSDSDCLSNFGPESAQSSASSLGERYSEYCISENSYQASSADTRPSRVRRSRSRQRKQRSCQSHRFQCTFCEMIFRRKFDWCRHEMSIHISLDIWTCPANHNLIETIGLGPRFDLPHPFGDPPECQVCNALVPDRNHWDIHDFDTCAKENYPGKVFKRKDHLQQHLQRYHKCSKLLSSTHLEKCRLVSNDVKSRCGFCGEELSTWSGRSQHIAKHFSDGAKMDQWQGDWGLEEKWMKRLQNVTRRLDRQISSSQLDLSNELVDDGVFQFQF